MTTPTGRRCVNFFGNVKPLANKVKDDSQARITSNSVKFEELAKKKTWRDEIEQANQLANEASLLFNEKMAVRHRQQRQSIVDKELHTSPSQEKKEKDSSSDLS